MSYITLKQAAELSGYHPDYLGYLIRKKKLQGKKISRDWLVLEESVKSYLSNREFLSLKDFLISKIDKPKMIFAGLMILISLGSLLVFNYFYSSQVTAQGTEGIEGMEGMEKEEIKELRVTGYSIEGGEEIKTLVEIY